MLDVTMTGPFPGKLHSLSIFGIICGDSGQTSSPSPFLNGLEQLTSSVTKMDALPRLHQHSIREPGLGQRSHGDTSTLSHFVPKGITPSLWLLVQF